MNIYDQLLEIHEQLSNDEMWLTFLEEAFEELEVDNIDDLIDKATENEDEGIICNLVSEGENILSMKDLGNFYDEDEFDEY
jgi:uncharacterized membrane protein YgaE (UPF0421/DUF939 family)